MQSEWRDTELTPALRHDVTALGTAQGIARFKGPDGEFEVPAAKVRSLTNGDAVVDGEWRAMRRPIEGGQPLAWWVNEESRTLRIEAPPAPAVTLKVGEGHPTLGQTQLLADGETLATIAGDVPIARIKRQCVLRVDPEPPYKAALTIWDGTGPRMSITRHEGVFHPDGNGGGTFALMPKDFAVPMARLSHTADGWALETRTPEEAIAHARVKVGDHLLQRAAKAAIGDLAERSPLVGALKARIAALPEAQAWRPKDNGISLHLSPGMTPTATLASG